MNAFFVFFLGLFWQIGFAQSGAQISFEAADNTIDMGSIKKGKDSGIRTFYFTNTGNQNLQIYNAQSACNCMQISFPQQAIPPQGKAAVTIQYNMAIGIISKTLSLETNAVNYHNGNVALRVRGEVVQ